MDACRSNGSADSEARDETTHAAPGRSAGLSSALLKLFAQKITQKEYLDAALRLITEWCGCRHGGIRILGEAGGIPYTSCTGFTTPFLDTENNLSIKTDLCACTRVISGRPEPQDIPAMTPYGSFHLNDAKQFMDGLSEKERARFIGACIRSGYASIAVIPIRYREQVLGAIHLADERKGMVPFKSIEFLEQMGLIIGEAVFRFRVEEDLRRSNDALVKSNELLENMFSNIHVMVAYMDRDFNFIRVNRSYADADGREPEYYVGRNHFDLFPNADNERIFRMVVETGEPYSVSEKAFEYAEHPERGVTYWDWSLVPVKDTEGMVAGVVLSLINVTERRRAMDELKKSQEMLRNLSAHVDAVREEERMSIAREIHDELGQVLTAMKMDMSWLKNRLPDDRPGLRKKAEEILSLIDDTIQTVKRISSELRPGVLDDLGLPAAIEWATREFERRTGIRCEFSSEPDTLSLDRNRATTIFRVLQESLTNVARHSQATDVKVSLMERDGEVVLSVKDNGRGISMTEVSDPAAFGLIGMRERVHFMGGRFSIEGAFGMGTAVVISIPKAGAAQRQGGDVGRSPT